MLVFRRDAILESFGLSCRYVYEPSSDLSEAMQQPKYTTDID